MLGEYFKQMTSKVVIVTGASRGIGLAVAESLLQQGNRVFLVARTAAPLQALKDKHPDQVEFLVGDLTTKDVAHQVTVQTMATYGQIDGVVINHGVITPIQRLTDADASDWKKAFNANFFSALAVVRSSIPHLRVTMGRMVFVSSGAAEHAYQGWGAYCITKAAVNGLVRQLQVEEPDIMSVAISPGRVDTDMQKVIRDKGRPGEIMTKEDYASFKSAYTEGSLIKPEVPAFVMAKVVTVGRKELSGGFFKWNAPEFSPYQDH